jgi:hypothetical protein
VRVGRRLDLLFMQLTEKSQLAGSSENPVSRSADMTPVPPIAKETQPNKPAQIQHPPISYKVVGRKEIGKARWDKFADESPTAWLWHRYDYADIWSLFPGREDVSFGLVDSATSELAAIVPMFKMHGRMVKWVVANSLDVFGGPAYNALLPKKAKAALLEALEEQLRKMASEHQAHEIKFSMAPRCVSAHQSTPGVGLQRCDGAGVGVRPPEFKRRSFEKNG